MAILLAKDDYMSEIYKIIDYTISLPL